MNQLRRCGLLLILGFLSGCSEFENLSYDFQRKPAGKVAILIDLPDQHAYLSKAGQVLLTAPVSTGREGYDTADTTLMLNETQAYLVFTRDPRFFNGDAVGMTQAEIDQLRAGFIANMPNFWLQPMANATLPVSVAPAVCPA